MLPWASRPRSVQSQFGQQRSLTRWQLMRHVRSVVIEKKANDVHHLSLIQAQHLPDLTGHVPLAQVALLLTAALIMGRGSQAA